MTERKTSQSLDYWLNDFLNKRNLQAVDGRNLFAYHISPSEFQDLGTLLHDKILAAASIYQSVLSYWGNNPQFGALFVLYASHWWQQNYDGTRFEWKPIMDALGFPPAAWDSSQMGIPVEIGLKTWSLQASSKGHKYLGSIAREAGLPQKLLSENKGSIGKILTRVLREALTLKRGGEIVHGWVSGMKDLLPKSYRDDVVISLLADSINAIIDIKNSLEAQTPEEALKELERKNPNWKERFPLPLYNEAALELLNQLLRDATSQPTTKTSQNDSYIHTKRKLVRRQSGTWELIAEMVLPDEIQLPFHYDNISKPRFLSLQITSKSKSYESNLRKHAQKDSYICTASTAPSFVGEDAACEIQLHFTTTSGVQNVAACPGGQELNEDLPWIFEAHEPDNIFRQQGGGNVRNDSMLIALCPNWEVIPDEHAQLEELGRLPGFTRKLFRLTGKGSVRKDSLQFKLQTTQIDSEIYYCWQGKRCWEYVKSPRTTYWGLPYPEKQTQSTTTPMHSAPLRWKRPEQQEFCSKCDNISGPIDLWYQASSGENLRNRMLILPDTARILFQPLNAHTGTITFDNWQIERICIANPYEGLCCKEYKDGNKLKILLSSSHGHHPPEQVTLLAYWSHSPEPARLCIPFPTQGARLFDSKGREIKNKTLLCVSDLFGMRLHCMTGNSKRMRFELVFSTNGQTISFPLDTSEADHLLIRIQDWQKEILEVLANATELDAYASMQIMADHKEMACWHIARYSNRLLRGESEIYLENIADTPIEYLDKLNIQAINLVTPQMGSQRLEGQTSHGVPTGRWLLKEALISNGPWLIFDATPHTNIRPVLWCIDTVPGSLIDVSTNRLEKAIGAPPEIRKDLFQECIAAMCDDPLAPEWKTLSDLTGHLAHLPLSTLEVWKELSRSGKAMAAVALRPDIDFATLTARASIELPFLWTSVSRTEWEIAAQQLAQLFVALTNEENAPLIFKFHIKKRREEISTHCPIITPLLHMSCPLEEDEEKLCSIEGYFTLQCFEDNVMQREKNNLCIRNANSSWPENFSYTIKKARQLRNVSRLLPASQDYRDSVVSLPVLLALQAYTGSNIVYDPATVSSSKIFNIRQHLNFDYDWFDIAYTWTTYCCFAEKIQTLECK